MGKTYRQILPQLADGDYSYPGEAFLKIIGVERRAVVLKVLHSFTAISESSHYYQRSLQSINYQLWHVLETTYNNSELTVITILFLE